MPIIAPFSPIFLISGCKNPGILCLQSTGTCELLILFLVEQDGVDVVHREQNACDHGHGVEQERYAAEAKKKWGKTDAWKEYEEKTAGKNQDQLRSAGDGLMDIFGKIGAVRHLDPASAEAQTLIEELRRYITDHFYTCTPQILKGLGQMYVAGGEMTENIDRASGPGTADFAYRAIEVYCAK